MLIVSRVTVRGTDLTILTNPDECEICHRTRHDCHTRPWPNHTFQPASATPATIPARWLMLPRINADELEHHRLSRRRQPREHLAPVIHINPNQGTIT